MTARSDRFPGPKIPPNLFSLSRGDSKIPKKRQPWRPQLYIACNSKTTGRIPLKTKQIDCPSYTAHDDNSLGSISYLTATRKVVKYHGILGCYTSPLHTTPLQRSMEPSNASQRLSVSNRLSRRCLTHLLVSCDHQKDQGVSTQSSIFNLLGRVRWVQSKGSSLIRRNTKRAIQQSTSKWWKC